MLSVILVTSLTIPDQVSKTLVQYVTCMKMKLLRGVHGQMDEEWENVHKEWEKKRSAMDASIQKNEGRIWSQKKVILTNVWCR